MVPIRPYHARIINPSFYDPLTIEGALLAYYTKGDTNKKLANVIFIPPHATGMELLPIINNDGFLPSKSGRGGGLSLPGFEQGSVSLERTIEHIQKTLFPQQQQQELLWPPLLATTDNNVSALDCIDYLIVWTRVNGANSLLMQPHNNTIGAQLRLFIDSHLECAQYFKHNGPWASLPQGNDLCEDGLGISPFSEDHIPDVPTLMLPMSPTPMDIIITGGETPVDGLEDIQVYFVEELLLKQQQEYTLLYLFSNYIAENAERIVITKACVQHFNPLRIPLHVDGVREHSIILASILMINIYSALLLLHPSKSGRGGGGGRDNRVVQTQYHKLLAAHVPFMFKLLAGGGGYDNDSLLSKDPKDYHLGILDLNFPTETSGFWAGDLPDLSCVLTQLVLWGEQEIKKKIPIVKIIIKTLPFSCQRRHLLTALEKNCRNSEGFWRIFGRMLWCTMGGLYPNAKRRPDFNSLLRLHYICNNRDALMESLKTSRDGCFIIFVTCREYFLYLLEGNPGYTTALSKRIDLEKFRSHTYEMADQMREYGRYADAPDDDPFKFAINALGRYEHSFKLDVYRFRKHNYTNEVLEQLNKMHDSLIFKGRVAQLKDIKLLDEALACFTRVNPPSSEEVRLEILNSMAKLRLVVEYFNGDPHACWERNRAEFVHNIRQAIDAYTEILETCSFTMQDEHVANMIDYLLRTTPEERLHFECLMTPQLGGISSQAVEILYRTKRVYYEHPSPKELKKLLVVLSVHDFIVISMYFDLMDRVETIRFIPMERGMYDEIEESMRHLPRPRPGGGGYVDPKLERIPDRAYDVYITLCCERVTTFKGDGTIGNKNLSYDPMKRTLICTKKEKKVADYIDVETLKDGRILRKRETTIPHGNPVIRINLRGRILSYRGKLYQFCPGCAGFHEYSVVGWAHNGYRCARCREAEFSLMHEPDYRCDFCGSSIINNGARKKGTKITIFRTKKSLPTPTTTITISDSGNGEAEGERVERKMNDDPMQAFQRIYMCMKHVRCTGRFKDKLPKHKLWQRIRKISMEKQMRILKKYC